MNRNYYEYFVLYRRLLFFSVLAVLYAFSSPDLWAQTTESSGAIRGSIKDSDFGDPLAGARISIQELGQSSSSQDGGIYSVQDLEPGIYTLTITKPGFIREIRRDVLVKPGEVTDINVELEQEVYELEEIVVEATDLIGGSEIALLQLRTETSALVDAIGSDLLSKAGASDASDALKFVVGATVSADKTATVRGLGDRYTLTTLNTARIPSSNPVKRAVELDQFPSSIIDSIAVNKTFLPDMQGEATGGQVDIRTKALPEGRVLKASASIGYNSQTTGNEDFITYNGAGEGLSFDSDGSRDLPIESLAPAGVGNATLGPQTELFDPTLFTSRKKAGPNQSYDIAIGDRIEIDSQQAFGVLFNLGWSNSFKQNA
ncbi:MAG: carboxypeptidase regulatory-like domain-containing protein, partial [Verrucomicrobiota bacterium]